MAIEAERRQEMAARIRALRGPVPQPVVADKVGVTLRAYQAWEAGGGVNWENLRKLADVFSVSEDYLLYGDASDRPSPATQLDRIERKLDAILEHLDVSREPDLDDLARALADDAQPSEQPPDTRERDERVRGQAD